MKTERDYTKEAKEIIDCFSKIIPRDLLPEIKKSCSRLEHEAGLMHSGECLICGEKS